MSRPDPGKVKHSDHTSSSGFEAYIADCISPTFVGECLLKVKRYQDVLSLLEKAKALQPPPHRHSQMAVNITYRMTAELKSKIEGYQRELEAIKEIMLRVIYNELSDEIVHVEKNLEKSALELQKKFQESILQAREQAIESTEKLKNNLLAKIDKNTCPVLYQYLDKIDSVKDSGAKRKIVTIGAILEVDYRMIDSSWRTGLVDNSTLSTQYLNPQRQRSFVPLMREKIALPKQELNYQFNCQLRSDFSKQCNLMHVVIAKYDLNDTAESEYIQLVLKIKKIFNDAEKNYAFPLSQWSTIKQKLEEYKQEFAALNEKHHSILTRFYGLNNKGLGRILNDVIGIGEKLSVQCKAQYKKLEESAKKSSEAHTTVAVAAEPPPPPYSEVAYEKLSENSEDEFVRLASEKYPEVGFFTEMHSVAHWKKELKPEEFNALVREANINALKAQASTIPTYEPPPETQPSAVVVSKTPQTMFYRPAPDETAVCEKAIQLLLSRNSTTLSDQLTNKNTPAKERLNGFIRLLHPGAIEEKLKNEAVSIIQEARQELEYDATQTRQSTLPTATTTKQDEETQQTRTPPKSILKN